MSRLSQHRRVLQTCVLHTALLGRAALSEKQRAGACKVVAAQGTTQPARSGGVLSL